MGRCGSENPLGEDPRHGDRWSSNQGGVIDSAHYARPSWRSPSSTSLDRPSGDYPTPQITRGTGEHSLKEFTPLPARESGFESRPGHRDLTGDFWIITSGTPFTRHILLWRRCVGRPVDLPDRPAGEHMLRINGIDTSVTTRSVSLGAIFRTGRTTNTLVAPVHESGSDCSF